MKTLISLLMFTCLLSVNSQAQSVLPTKLHFLNTMAGALWIPEVKTTMSEKSIVIKPRIWYVVQTTSDSVGFLLDKTPYYLHFGPGKQYYFIIQTYTGDRQVVLEKSEREFVLTAMVESVKGEPEVHVLNKVSN